MATLFLLRYDFRPTRFPFNFNLKIFFDFRKCLNENNIFKNKSKLFTKMIRGCVPYKTLNVLHTTSYNYKYRQSDVHIQIIMFCKHLNNVSQLKNSLHDEMKNLTDFYNYKIFFYTSHTNTEYICCCKISFPVSAHTKTLENWLDFHFIIKYITETNFCFDFIQERQNDFFLLNNSINFVHLTDGNILIEWHELFHVFIEWALQFI